MVNPRKKDKTRQQQLKRLLAQKRKKKNVADYYNGILIGNRVILGQAITLAESENPERQMIAQKLLEKCLPHSGNAIRIGVTGTPGVGKSTFIESFGKHLIEQDKKIAILTVDPSSKLSKGSILGDKTRMPYLSTHPHVFIRPSPAGTTLGGVAHRTREALILCEAAGYDMIIIETVGVGQSEIAVHSIVDFFMLLLLPGAGDELQGIKRGIVEMADLVVINKADGERKGLAKITKTAYRNALHLFPPKENEWIPKVVLCSAIENKGIEMIAAEIDKYINLTKGNQFFEKKRKQQAFEWLHENINNGLRMRFFENDAIKKELNKIEKAVLLGKLTAYQGAKRLLEIYKS